MVTCIQTTRDCKSHYVLVESWVLFPYYILWLMALCKAIIRHASVLIWPYMVSRNTIKIVFIYNNNETMYTCMLCQITQFHLRNKCKCVRLNLVQLNVEYGNCFCFSYILKCIRCLMSSCIFCILQMLHLISWSRIIFYG